MPWFLARVCPQEDGGHLWCRVPVTRASCCQLHHLGGVEYVREYAAPHTLKYTAIALDMAVQRGYRTMLSIEPKKDA